MHLISAATQRGTRELAEAVMRFLEERREAAALAAVEAGNRPAPRAPAARVAAKKATVAVPPASRGKPKPNVQSRKKARPQAVLKAESKARLKAKAKVISRARAKAKVKAKARAKREAKGKSRANARARRGRA